MITLFLGHTSFGVEQCTTGIEFLSKIQPYLYKISILGQRLTINYKSSCCFHFVSYLENNYLGRLRVGTIEYVENLERMYTNTK